MGLLLSTPLFFLKNPYKKQHLITFLILIVATILEFYGTYTYLRKINNTIAYNLFFVYAETLLILWFFSSILKTNISLNVIKIVSITFIILGLTFAFLTKDLDSFHAIPFSIGCFVIITCCIYFFSNIFVKEWYTNENLLTNPIFWIVTFLFLFYSATFLYFSSLNLLVSVDQQLNYILGTINRIMAVLMYLGMGFSFYIPMLVHRTFKLS